MKSAIVFVLFALCVVTGPGCFRDFVRETIDYTGKVQLTQIIKLGKNDFHPSNFSRRTPKPNFQLP